MELRSSPRSRRCAKDFRSRCHGGHSVKTGKPLDRRALESHPLPPVVDGDKETKGRILVIAGSRRVPGAALLTATAAMRAGAGKLRIATVESAAPQLGMAMPEAMVIGLPEDEEGGFHTSVAKRIGADAAEADSVIAGPGMSAGPVCEQIADALLRTDARLALDAALLRSLQPSSKREHPSLPLLLPHAGELASLLDCDERRIEGDPVGCGERAAELYGAV